MKHLIFTEKELESIFSGKKAKKDKAKIFKYIKPVISFVIITAVVFVGLNFQELKQNFLYWYNTNYNKSNNTASTDYGQQILESINLNNNQSTLATNLPPLPQLEDNHLKVPSIDVVAPITWKINNEPKSVSDNLINGLIQINGTALPGEKGNIFITGHSSNYPWIKSDYNNVFALLNKVVVGDVIHLKYSNQDYLYRVNNIKVVQPDDLSPMAQTSNPTLTLMTCTPVGTSLRRLIVTAKQYYPDPNKNTTSSASSSEMKMPTKVR
ncbi:MAG: sortase [Patescibacteria group bacterium]|jgi:LPXTG-site transpeptidase (sortase) family protein